jgi:hypothetical protein
VAAQDSDHRQEFVVELPRRIETGEAPDWQGATTYNIGNF